METSEVLNRAADIVEEFGWKQGGWGLAYNGQPITAVCAEGAIMAAAGVGEIFWAAGQGYAGAHVALAGCPANRAVMSYLADDDVEDEGLNYWNDEPGRTAAEVIEVLRACALIEAAREEQDAAWQTYADVASA